jgi:hypothetical protein
VHSRLLTCAVTAKVRARLITPAFRERLRTFPGGLARLVVSHLDYATGGRRVIMPFGTFKTRSKAARGATLKAGGSLDRTETAPLEQLGRQYEWNLALE